MTGHQDATEQHALAFETSSAMGAVALGLGDQVLEVGHFSGPRRHASEFLPTIAALCEAHGVSASCIGHVYVSSGPGSFTGLRIGATAARMIALAVGAKIVCVPTLDVIAQNALDANEPPDHVAVMLDAKRGRVYAAGFVREAGQYVALKRPVEADPAEFLAAMIAKSASCAVMGEGVQYHRPAVESSGVAILPADLYPPRAETVFRLGRRAARERRFADRRTVIPVYVRPPEAEEKWQARVGSD